MDPPHAAPGLPAPTTCPHGHFTTSFCTECAKDSMRAELLRELPAPRPGPTFNHTRSDGPFDPCPECAALMSPAGIMDAVRGSLSDLVLTIQMQVKDPSPDLAERCAAAGRLLKATAVNRVGTGDGAPTSAAVAPTPPSGEETRDSLSAGVGVGLEGTVPVRVNGEALLGFEIKTVTGAGNPDDELCQRCAC
jgi:hypothetical protein